MIDYQTRDILSDQTVRRVFREVAEERSIRFGELVRRLSSRNNERSKVPSGGGEVRTPSSGLSTDHIKIALDRLESVKLIKSKKSSVDRLNIYYITSKGLSVKRKMKKYK